MSKLSLLMANPDKPLKKKLRTAKLNSLYEALRSIEQDADPEISAWNELSTAVKLTDTLINCGPWQLGDLEVRVEDSQGLLKDAMQALSIAGLRRLEGKPLRLDGAGIQAVRATLADYATCLENLSERSLLRAIIVTRKRFP
jgi:hypothetical protein